MLTSDRPRTVSRPRRPSRHAFTLRRALDAWPLLVWLAVVAVLIQVYRGNTAFKRMNGVVLPTPASSGAASGASGPPHAPGTYPDAIAPLESGILREILVEVGEPVTRGQVLARMEAGTSAADAAEQAFDQEIERVQMLTRLRSDLLDAEDDRRQLRLDAASDEAALATTRAALADLEELLTNRLPVDDAMRELQIEASSLEARLALLPEMRQEIDATIAELHATIAQVESRVESRPGAHGDPSAETPETAFLRASRDGIVDRIEFRVGELVAAGSTVIHLTARPEEILAFVPQEEARNLEVGAPVWVSPTSDRHTFHPSRITRLPPQIWNLTDPVSPLNNRRVHGRKVHLALPTGADLLPGQTVIVHLDRPGRIPFLNPFLDRMFPQAHIAAPQ